MKNYKRGDIVIIQAPLENGSCVQGGTRPFVIVQNDKGNRYSPTTIVCPLTTKTKREYLPTHVWVACKGIRPSVIECEQVRVVDKRDIVDKMATLSDDQIGEVDRAVWNAFFYKDQGVY